jgi:hypothetical protein
MATCSATTNFCFCSRTASKSNITRAWLPQVRELALFTAKEHVNTLAPTVDGKLWAMLHNLGSSALVQVCVLILAQLLLFLRASGYTTIYAVSLYAAAAVSSTHQHMGQLAMLYSHPCACSFPPASTEKRGLQCMLLQNIPAD